MNPCVCPLCGTFPDDGLRKGFMGRHRDSAGHLARVEHVQREVLRATLDKARWHWVKDNSPWLVEEVHVPIEERQLRMERVEEVELLVEKGRVFHVPLPGREGTALCGLVLRSGYELVDRFKLPVGEAAFRICEVCDSDGRLQREELERVQMEIRTCPYCLGVFGSVGARKAHEEECGL